VSPPAPFEILRATLFHAPRNPFRTPGSLVFHEDGALLLSDGRIAACDDYAAVRQAHPQAPVRDLRGGVLLPGFVDTHVHYPQVRILGCLGHGLLEWLQRYTLPEESKFEETAYARTIAAEFVRSLAAHGTTTALVFGSHFPDATGALFEAAHASGLRITSGMVLSDRHLRAELHQSPEKAYRESSRLIREFHGAGRLLYAVTPRFALSCSDAMLEVCGALLRENPGVRFQTHLNESQPEVKEVATISPAGTPSLRTVCKPPTPNWSAWRHMAAASPTAPPAMPRSVAASFRCAATWRARFTSPSAATWAAAPASAC
jgi:guanine deaminase